MDRETHEYFYRQNKKSVAILREEIHTIQLIINSDPAWMKDETIRRHAETMLSVTREHLADHQKDLVIHAEALKR